MSGLGILQKLNVGVVPRRTGFAVFTAAAHVRAFVRDEGFRLDCLVYAVVELGQTSEIILRPCCRKLVDTRRLRFCNDVESERRDDAYAPVVRKAIERSLKVFPWLVFIPFPSRAFEIHDDWLSVLLNHQIIFTYDWLTRAIHSPLKIALASSTVKGRLSCFIAASLSNVLWNAVPKRRHFEQCSDGRRSI